MWRGDDEEEQLSNELEAHWEDWHLAGAGIDQVWIKPGAKPEPELVLWCEQHEFEIIRA